MAFPFSVGAKRKPSEMVIAALAAVLTLLSLSQHHPGPRVVDRRRSRAADVEHTLRLQRNVAFIHITQETTVETLAQRPRLDR